MQCKNSADCFKQSSPQDSVILNLYDYENIHTNSYFNITIRQNPSEKLIIRGAKHLIEKISVENIENELVIRNNDPCAFLKNPDEVINLEFLIPEVDTLFFDTYINLQIPDTFHTDTLKIHYGGKMGECDIKLKTKIMTFFSFSEHGIFNISGSCRGFKCSSTKGGIINADKFLSHWVIATNYGIADIKISAAKEILAYIYNKGNILYANSPSIIELSRYGTGNLIPLQ